MKSYTTLSEIYPLEDKRIRSRKSKFEENTFYVVIRSIGTRHGIHDILGIIEGKNIDAFVKKRKQIYNVGKIIKEPNHIMLRRWFWLGNELCEQYKIEYPDECKYNIPGGYVLSSSQPDYWTNKDRFWTISNVTYKFEKKQLL